MLPHVRKALEFSAVLRRSGFLSREARIILTLAAEVWRQRAKVARIREDRAQWRRTACAAMKKHHEKITK